MSNSTWTAICFNCCKIQNTILCGMWSCVQMHNQCWHCCSLDSIYSLRHFPHLGEICFIGFGVEIIGTSKRSCGWGSHLVPHDSCRYKELGFMFFCSLWHLPIETVYGHDSWGCILCTTWYDDLWFIESWKSALEYNGIIWNQIPIE